MKRTCFIAAATALGVASANAADLKTYSNALSTQTWSWGKTRADQQQVGGEPQAVIYNHVGNLSDGLRDNSGSSAATLRRVSGPARIDNGLPELPPEPYASNTGTSHAYPVPGSYTGVFGLYNGDVSAYSAAHFPDANNVLMGTYTQAQVDAFLANPVGPTGFSGDAMLDAMAASRFNLTLSEIAAGVTTITFQLRIQGMGPTVANVLNGTYLTTYDAVSQVFPVTLAVGSTVLDAINAELLSYENLGVGGRNAFAGGGFEEVWEFTWDVSDLEEILDEATISFVNYPTSVISGIAVNQLAVPEPSTYALLIGFGAAAVALQRRRRAHA